MAMVMDQEQRKQEHEQEQARHKHYCRICRKGFGCGRALGGHMRVHGINDEQAHDLDDDPPPNAGGSEWDDKQINPPAGSKRMYALRNNATRLRTYCVCENCGKEFPSWKSFLEHGRCNSDDDPDEFSPPMSPPSDDGDGGPAAGWYKGKRSRRAKPSSVTPPPLTGASTEEEDLANCLIMLSAARVDPVALIAETEESSASASKEDDDDRAISMRYRPPASTPPRPKFPVVTQPIAPIAQPVPRGMFECKACKKVFTSHQALGGHRASHKKVKGCFAAKLDPDPDESTPPDDEMDQIGFSPATSLSIVPFIDNPQPVASAPLKKKSKVHECSICRRQFASGQALGGHKRCHWITSSSGSVDPVPTVSVKLHHHMPEVGSSSGAHHHDFTLRPMFDSSEALDLNLPAPADDLAGIPLRLDAPTAFYIKPPWGIDRKGKVVLEASGNDMINNSNDERNQQDLKTTTAILDDEAESKVKLAKLSDLKDMNEGGESSPWLQVGIGGSATDNDGCQDINN